jgi:hypothetical protein
MVLLQAAGEEDDVMPNDMWRDLNDEDRGLVRRLELAGYSPCEALHLIWSTRPEPDTEVPTAITSAGKSQLGSVQRLDPHVLFDRLGQPKSPA